MSKQKENPYGDRIWTTGSGEKISVKNMATSHLFNTIRFIEKNKKEELESQRISGVNIQRKLASILSVQEKLAKLKSPGAEYLESAVKDLKSQLNNDFNISQAAIAKALADNETYQGMLLEVEKRSYITPKNNITQKIESFLEPKTTAKVANITKNPDSIPMIVEVEVNPKDDVHEGDYIINCNQPLFQITFLSKYHPSAKKMHIELTINARTEAEKQLVMEHLDIGENVLIF